MATFDASLTRVLAREFDDFEGLESCVRLSGGANQETYRVVMRTAAGQRQICLRRAAGGGEGLDHASGQPGLEGEAALFKAAAAVGVPEPEIYYVLHPDDGIGAGFLMEWLEGETLGARIARGDAFAAIRPQLARQCGKLLARIHAVDVDAAGLRDVLEVREPRATIEMSWARYQEFGTPQPMIDYAARWLLSNLPASGKPTLTHGDFRNGNLMVTPDDGIVAVLDWEGAHMGDPMRDLGWLCTNSWRFGRSEYPVGGFGNLEDLLAGYAEESGAPVPAEHVKFWIVYGSFNWAIGCLSMAEHYRTGPDATVERPAIGRRSSECQIDCANLLIPGQVDLPDAGAAAESLDMPTAQELLTSVRDFLRNDIVDETEGRTQFLARVAANSLDIVLREGAEGAAYRAREHDMLKALLGSGADYFTLKNELCERIRGDQISLDDPALQDYLRYATLTQALVDQPGYSGVRTAGVTPQR